MKVSHELRRLPMGTKFTSGKFPGLVLIKMEPLTKAEGDHQIIYMERNAFILESPEVSGMLAPGRTVLVPSHTVVEVEE